jgi:hypothetical protein
MRVTAVGQFAAAVVEAEEQKEAALALWSSYALNAQDVVGVGGTRGVGPDGSAVIWNSSLDNVGPDLRDSCRKSCFC